MNKELMDGLAKDGISSSHLGRREETLREKIANRVAESRCEVCDACGATISTDNPYDVADEVLALIKEAGYMRLADDQNFPKQYGKVAYERLLAVLLDHKIDISLLDSVVGETQIDMLEASWRRMKLEEGK